MPNDHELLQGFWKLTSCTLNGQLHPHPDSGSIFQFSGNRFRHLRSRVSYRFVVYPNISPKGIDIILPSTKALAPGIYELNGDRLQVMQASWRGIRPLSFDDPQYRLDVYTRFRRNVSVKRRTRSQVPETAFPGSLVPKGLL